MSLQKLFDNLWSSGRHFNAQPQELAARECGEGRAGLRGRVAEGLQPRRDVFILGGVQQAVVDRRQVVVGVVQLQQDGAAAAEWEVID